MSWWEAVILGLVEGLTEYLPVSSTGHLLVTQALLGIGTESPEAERAANAYAICIQAGAIVAVLGLYWGRVKQSAIGWAGKVGVGPGDKDGFQLGLNLVAAFMPAAILGVLFDDKIEEHLFHPWFIVGAWFVGGVAILTVCRWNRRSRKGPDEEVAPSADKGKALELLTWRMALIIGLMQCVAMLPGTSRSLATIVGGLLVGLSVASAVEFSFLLGVITLCAATVYKAVLDSVQVDLDGDGVEEQVLMIAWMAREYGWWVMMIGSVTAWISAVVSVKWMVGYLKKRGLEVFGYYRIVIAIVVAGLILGGVMKA
ncbi:MAG: undecaprenyl-diphosphate phosphatase [Planctomycetota bacterium]